MAQQIRANALYQSADEYWRRGRLKQAFRFFLAAAKAGVPEALATLGNFYDYGTGVRADEEAALRWYRRAYVHGSSTAANNIGCIWRDRGKLGRALMWLRRAVNLGDGDANLNIAKIYLRKHNLKKAIRYLQRTLKGRNVTEGSKEEARHLLRQIRATKSSAD